MHTLTLLSMACLRGMLVAQPQPGAPFSRLQSLRLHLGKAAIDSPSGYEAIAIASPWLNTPQPGATSHDHRSTMGDGCAAVCMQQAGGSGHSSI
ncbi:hypothetical protein FOA52_001566 [Chlamydomonas sp. UWO 241]|nr:hypothetical protein FOA52_001566 [Chlamydomonas sp. UWO 241]